MALVYFVFLNALIELHSYLLKIKILFTIPNFDTAGSGKALLNLARGLNKENFEAHIACLHNSGEFFNVVKASGIPVHVFNYISPARPLFKLLISCWKVSRKFRKIKPDIIHSFNYSADYTEAMAARMARIPWVFTKKNMSWKGPSIRAWKLRSALAKKIVVQNTNMINQFYPRHKNISIIPRGVDTQKFAPQVPELSLREKMQTREDARIIICVANFVPVKGIEILLQSFKTLAPNFPGWILWLVGDGANDYGKVLQAWVRDNGMEASVKFSGKQEDIRRYLDLAEIFVLPTLDKGEGSPVAMLEAMANGKVVIGSAVPGIMDQLKNYPQNLFIPGDPDSLAGKLSVYMNSSTVANQGLGKMFIEEANNFFSIEKEILAHEIFYKSLV
jgi:glycosyltransferase involved in cell wall biosynthesis